LAKRASVTLLQAAGAEMMHLPRSSSVRQHLQAQPAMLAAPPPGLEVEHLATLAALIAQGLGTKPSRSVRAPSGGSTEGRKRLSTAARPAPLTQDWRAV